MAAVGAGASRLIGVEGLKDRREIGGDVTHLQLHLVHHAGALGAVPLELLQGALTAWTLKDEADGSGLGSLGGMRQIAR